MSQLLRVHNFGVSLDGFGSGAGQSLERPFGHANPAEMFAWAGATASWPNRTDPAPLELGRGERLWTSPDALLDRFHLERVPSPSGVTHLLLWRR